MGSKPTENGEESQLHGLDYKNQTANYVIQTTVCIIQTMNLSFFLTHEMFLEDEKCFLWEASVTILQNDILERNKIIISKTFWWFQTNCVILQSQIR